MIRQTRKITAWTLAACISASALSGGCAIDNPLGFIGPNLTINLILPLGLNGNPGLLNPFGIIQALVAGTLNLASTNGTNTGTGGTGGSGGNNVPPVVL